MSDQKTHYAKLEASDQSYQVFYQGELIFESNQIIKLNEHYDGKDFPAVIYFPHSSLADLEATKTAHSTHCPIKGDASYWSYREAENGIWAYENPIQELAQIKDYVAFNRKKGFKVAVKLAD